MSRLFSVAGSQVTIAAASTLVAINPGVTRSLGFIRAWVGQDANATSAQESIQLNTKATAFSTLTSATPQKLTISDAAAAITGGTAGAAGTAGINASAEGGGATTVIWPDAFNVLNGWLWVPTPKEIIMFPASSSLAFALKFVAAPATLTGWSFGVNYKEIG